MEEIHQTFRVKTAPNIFRNKSVVLKRLRVRIIPQPLKYCLMLAMSNQRSFKIESFRFAAFVPKKIEYISFWNKILDRNKTFCISTRKIWSKSFCSGPFLIFFGTTKSFVLSLENPGAICKVLVSFWYHFLKIQKFCFDSEQLEANKNVPNQ